METIFYDYNTWQILYSLVKQAVNMSANKEITEEQFIFEGFTAIIKFYEKDKDKDKFSFVIEQLNKCDSRLKIQIFRGMPEIESVDCYLS